MKRIGTRLVRIALAIAGSLVVLVLVAWSYDAVASTRALRSYPAPGAFLDVGGTKVHYVCMGSGEPTLVLQHGYAGGALDFQPLMEVVSRTQRVCALDRPGSDYSAAPSADSMNVDRLLEDWHAALRQLDIEHPVVVGHSLGGALALLYAARYPVQGVVLVDGLSSDAADAVTRRLGSYRMLVPLARLGLLRPIAPTFVHPSYEGALRERMLALRSRGASITAVGLEGGMAVRELGTERLRAAEEALQVPLLILAAGATDVPEGEAFTAGLRSLGERRPDDRLQSFPGASHYLMVTHPDEVAAAILDWLRTFAP